MQVSHPRDLTTASKRFQEGQQLLSDRCLEQALACLNLAERLGYSASECRGARWQCWMLLGDFERAWQESDRITASGIKDPHRFWDGSRWDGRRVILRCLHGLGDATQFIRYATLLRHTCSFLVVQTHPEMVRLLQGVPGIDLVTSWGPGFEQGEPAWDMQMEVTELPFAFRTTLGTIPTVSPYIEVSEERRQWASKLLATFPSGFRVGITWRAGPHNPLRSVPASKLKSLLQVPGCEFFSLQKGAASSASNLLLHDLGTYTMDVCDTAALIKQLDLVISVDTLTAHLAGALNIPVLIMLPRTADWRWLLSRRDSPWYSSVTLFRQSEKDDWTNVIDETATHLQYLSRGEHAAQR